MAWQPGRADLQLLGYTRRVWQVANNSHVCSARVWVTTMALAGDPSGGGSSRLLPLHSLLLGAGSSNRHRRGTQYINHSPSQPPVSRSVLVRRREAIRLEDRGVFRCGGASSRPVVLAPVIRATTLTGWLTGWLPDAQRGSLLSTSGGECRAVHRSSSGPKPATSAVGTTASRTRHLPCSAEWSRPVKK